MATKYTSIEEVYSFEPRIGSASNITSAHVLQHIEMTEAMIDSHIVKMYDLDALTAANSVPALAAVSVNMSTYSILAKRVFTQQRLKDSSWPDRFKESEKFLEKIAEGELTLVAADGSIIAARTDIAEMWSNTMDYVPTMSELPPELNRLDPDKRDDLEDDRDVGGFRNILE